ncbi:HET-domain-containing protein [Hypoxylon sp. NC0597]|nr:HET-domain-containing protein [Hypoxylon sp. NC0597]
MSPKKLIIFTEIRSFIMMRHLSPYSPLDPLKKEIRLLEVLPEISSTTLQTHLVHAFLVDPTPYETISYCWGDASSRATILLDGSAFDVPASSLAALKCIRKMHETRRVWIDAICINQDDVNERGSQVALMSRIYQCSQLNLIVLGNEDESARRAFACVADLLREIRHETDDFSTFHRMMREFVWGMRSNINQPIECDLDEYALCSFFARPWFERLWVIQEAALAPVSICFCGPNLTIDLVDLVRAAIWLCYKRHSIPRSLSDHDGMNNAADLWSMVDDRDAHKASENPYEVNLATLLLISQYRLSSDPKDKVFAIVGLLPQIPQSAEENETALLATDYNKPLVQILCDATRYSIQELNSLRILQAVSQRSDAEPSSSDYVPSWVARVDHPFDEKRDAESIPFNTFQADSQVGINRECARVDFSGPKKLSVTGELVSEVKQTSDLFTYEVFENRVALARLLGSVLGIVRSGNQTEMGLWGDNQGIDDGFSPMLATTLIAGNMASRIPEDDEIRTLCEFLNALVAGAETHDPDNRLFYALQSACQNRRFFLGSNGVIGLGPRSTTAGDIATILYGGSVPFMLRDLDPMSDEDSTFRLLGEAYVYGVMDGSWVRLGERLDHTPWIYTIV